MRTLVSIALDPTESPYAADIVHLECEVSAGRARTTSNITHCELAELDEIGKHEPASRINCEENSLHQE